MSKMQWNPAAPKWGHIYWGHVMSKDLAHWQRVPTGLVPDTLFDFDGVFSGSASLQEDGQPVILYTGVSNYSEYGYYYQVCAGRARHMPCICMQTVALRTWRSWFANEKTDAAS